MSRARLNIFLEPDHGRHLSQLAGMKGVSKSAIVAAALSSYLAPDGGDRREAAIAKRLDKLTRQFDRLERDQTILIETVALFVRYTLTVNAPIPAAHQDAARAQGRERFQQFVDQLARLIGYGAILCGAIWLLRKFARVREAERAEKADRERLDTLKEANPQAYEKEVWWRENMDRKRNGLSTDPAFEEESLRQVQSLKEAGLL